MSKNPKERAEQLARQTAMKCTGSIINDTRAILDSIPIVEYEKCVEALRTTGCLTHEQYKRRTTALANLDAKLNEKGQP